MAIKRTTDVEVLFQCECGKRWHQPMKHYEIVRCHCGRFHWVLQPKRGGPFKSFPWPGLRVLEPEPSTTDEHR